MTDSDCNRDSFKSNDVGSMNLYLEELFARITSTETRRAVDSLFAMSGDELGSHYIADDFSKSQRADPDGIC